ncbi:RNA-binding protein pop5 [Sorochytrium milnesiophthora]
MVRLKNRYLLFQLSFKDKNKVDTALSTETVKRAIRDSIDENFGVLGAGLTGHSLTVKYFSAFTNVGIVRATRDHYRIAWAAMTFVTQILQQPCRIVVLHCSGTIIKCQKAALKYDAEQMRVLQKQMEASQPSSRQAYHQIEQQNRKEILRVT